MSFPSNTQWSVAPFDNNGTISSFHPTPWEFGNGTMQAQGLWNGEYQHTPSSSNTIKCHLNNGDMFEVIFVTTTRFIATKNGGLYRFGKLI
ncbi:hypothetical protein LQR31_02840 [Chromobacterium vaccinii]|uniref:hypothetical protein n=1 Tax=Chromobacterium vaccinii TaxID=1108595 RepID=UPI001E4F2490|nr:hypothetical protein [Chromobacterium vaccinii]MCD4483408.1 hypothetical protein [Chromobacterium vaccinii]